MSVAQIVLGLALLATFAYMLQGYPNRYGALTGRSRLYRTAGIFFFSLLLLLGLMSTYIDFYAEVSQRAGAIRQLFYYLACVVLAFLCFSLALLDSLESFSAVRREKRKYMEAMVQEEYERLLREKQAETGTSSTDSRRDG